MCGSSQKSSPRLIQLDKDTLIGFSLPQTDILGEKLILKNYLIGRNYELERANEQLKSHNQTQKEAIESLQSEVSKAEGKERLATELFGSYKGYYERYKGLYEAEEKSKRIWRTVAAVATGIAATSTGILILKK